MLAEYRIRREARLLVASRLTAVANDALQSTANATTSTTSLPTTTTSTTTPTISTPTTSSQTAFEYVMPGEVRQIATTTQTKNALRQEPYLMQPLDVSRRSVETQTPTSKLQLQQQQQQQQPSVVSFNLRMDDESRPSIASNLRRPARQMAQSTIITAAPEIAPADTDADGNPIGCYTNWGKTHAAIAAAAWCCIGDLMAFCDKYEFRALGVHDTRTQQTIVQEVKSLLAGVSQAPFDVRRRFPANIRNTENLWVCIDRCPSVEYHLKRLLSIFRRPLAALTVEKQRAAVQTFHLAINELRLDISARISEVHLYDRSIFEREFHLIWADTPRTQSTALTKATTTTITGPTTTATTTSTINQYSYRRV